MASEELKKITDKLSEQGKMDFFESAKEEDLVKFEEEKKLKLPEKYKEWLLFSDGGECFLPAGVQFYGVTHKPIIDVNYDDRPDDTYVVIGALSTGDPILFKKDSEEVAIYNHEEGRIEEDEKYESFFLLLEDLYDLLGIGG